MNGWRCAICQRSYVIGWGGVRYLPSLHYRAHHPEELSR